MRKATIGLWLAFGLSLFSPASAMKPAAPKKVTQTDPQSGHVVTSDPSTKRTEVRRSDGSVVWSMDTFIGRRVIHLSPDGTTLLLFGGHHFGSVLSTNPESVVVEVFTAGTKGTALRFEALFGMSITDAMTRFELHELSGGWFSSNEMAQISHVDWTERKIHVQFKDSTTGTASF